MRNYLRAQNLVFVALTLLCFLALSARADVISYPVQFLDSTGAGVAGVTLSSVKIYPFSGAAPTTLSSSLSASASYPVTLTTITTGSSSVVIEDAADGDYLFNYDAEASGEAYIKFTVTKSGVTFANGGVFTVVCGKDSSRIQKALPNANAAAAGGLLTAGSGANQINADGTGAVPIALGTTLPTNPTANTTGEAFFAAGQRVGRRNTAQSGTTSTITLDASASASDNLYRDYLIKITSGTGAGQFRTITSYVGSTKAATVDFAWATTPDATSVFAIFPQPVVDVALWNGAAPNALISGRVDSNAQAVASTLNFNHTGQTTKYGVTLLNTDVTGNLPANVTQIAGQTASASTAVAFPASVGTSTYAGGPVASVTAGVTVATNNDKTGYALMTAEHTAISGDILSATASSFNSAGTIGNKINAAGSATDPNTGTLSTYTTAGTVGNLLRIFSAGVDSSGRTLMQPTQAFNNTGQTTKYAATIASGDNADKSGYALTTAPPTLAGIVAGIWGDSTAYSAGSKGAQVASAGSASDPLAALTANYNGAGTFGKFFKDQLDQTVGSRMATFTYVAPDNASVLAVKAKTDNLPSDPASNTQVNTRLAASAAPPNFSVLSIAPSTGQVTATNGGSGGGGGDPFTLPIATAYDAGSFGALFKSMENCVLSIKTVTDQVNFTNGYVDVRVKEIDAGILAYIANAVQESVVDGTITTKQKDAIILAVLAGKMSFTPPSTPSGPTTTAYKRQDGITTIYTSSQTYSISAGVLTSRQPTYTNLP